MSYLELSDLRVKFGRGAGAFEAVRGVSGHVLEGEAVGIVGESGSGKSTVARVLLGLTRPSAGRVEMDGRTLASADRGYSLKRSERSQIQMIFQDPYSSLNPKLKAWEAVAEALTVWRGLNGPAAKTAALDLLTETGITASQAESRPHSLSGGQRQRVSIARALAPDPKILVADEPTSSVDQSAQAQLVNLLQALRRDRGLTIVFISHDLNLVRHLTSRTYVMRAGEFVDSGQTEVLFAEPSHPYTAELVVASGPARESG